MSTLVHDQIVNSLRNREIVIEPLLDCKQVDCASIDLRLDNYFAEFRTAKTPCIDPGTIGDSYKNYLDMVEIEFFEDCYYLQPKRFVLAQTFEYVSLPNNIVGHLEGRSSVAREGLTVHGAAGLVDPGFHGHLVFELLNAGEMPLALYPLMRVAKMSFERTDETKPYSGPYSVQVRIVPPENDMDVIKIKQIRKRIKKKTLFERSIA